MPPRTTSRKKTASRKKTTTRKTASRRKTARRTRSVSRTRSAPRRSLARSRSLSRPGCPLSRSVTDTGRCGPAVPCLDAKGDAVPYLVRGPDGSCRVRSCGAGSIRNPATGNCISRYSADGERLAMAQKHDEAKRLAESYDAAGVGTYYDQFTAQNMEKHMNEQRTLRKARVADIVGERARQENYMEARNARLRAEELEKLQNLERQRQFQASRAKSGLMSRIFGGY